MMETGEVSKAQEQMWLVDSGLSLYFTLETMLLAARHRVLTYFLNSA